MSDRELLELAAKAAEITGQIVGNDPTIVINDKGKIVFWNPLDKDGDALRLAVKLEATIFQSANSVIVELDSDCDDPPIHKKEYCDDETRSSATRRAIVRAAAEIGKGMGNR